MILKSWKAINHQPVKLSELAQRYMLKHQPARLAATIHQEQKAIEELD